MLDPMVRSAVVAFFVTGIASAAPASGAPAVGASHARAFVPMERVAPARGPQLAPLRLTHSVPAFLSRRSGPAAAIQAMPLRVKEPALLFPALLPRPTFARFITPLLTQSCPTARPNILIAALPPTPMSPIACGSAPADDRALPTSLVPGRNKQALYGPAYSPDRDVAP